MDGDRVTEVGVGGADEGPFSGLSVQLRSGFDHCPSVPLKSHFVHRLARVDAGDPASQRGMLKRDVQGDDLVSLLCFFVASVAAVSVLPRLCHPSYKQEQDTVVRYFPSHFTVLTPISDSAEYAVLLVCATVRLTLESLFSRE